VYPSPAVADTPHAPPTVFAGSQDHHFYALDAKTGAIRWEHPMNGNVLGSSSVVDRTVYVSVIGPNIGTYGYAVKKGQKVFYNDQGEYNPVISDGKTVYLTGTSTIRAFKPLKPGEEPKHRKGKGSKHGGGAKKDGNAGNRTQRRTTSQMNTSAPGEVPAIEEHEKQRNKGAARLVGDRSG
jgi:hypothetical protein